ncbi:MAG: PAS domain-containing protein, partial [Betaproteobacteria bacterium]
MRIRIHPWIASAGVAVTVAGIAILLRASFTPIWGNRLAFLFSFPAVVIAAWYGHRLGGLICTGMLAIAGFYYMHPFEGVDALGAEDFLAAALFTVFGAIISSIVGRLQKQIEISEDLARAAREADGARRAVLESIHNGFFVLNGEWKITYINTQAERMVGAAPGTLLGRNFWELYPTLLGTPLEACYRRVASTGGVEQIENFYAPLGKWFEGRVSAAAGGAVSVMFQDVTEQKRMVDALRQSRSTLEVIIEGTDEFIYTKDLEGRFTLVNRALQRLLQKSSDELIGKTLAEVLPDPSLGVVIAESDRRVMQLGSAETVEETVATPVGTNVYLTTKSPRLDEQGKVIGMIGVATDITARKRIESELRSARDVLATEVVERTSELIELSHHLIQVTETEKARLAAELHDALGGSLTTLGLSLVRLKGRSEPVDAPRAAAFAQVEATLQEVVSMTRRIIGDLRPVTLDTLGLVATLQDHVDRWS